MNLTEGKIQPFSYSISQWSIQGRTIIAEFDNSETINFYEVNRKTDRCSCYCSVSGEKWTCQIKINKKVQKRAMQSIASLHPVAIRDLGKNVFIELAASLKGGMKSNKQLQKIDQDNQEDAQTLQTIQNTVKKLASNCNEDSISNIQEIFNKEEVKFQTSEEQALQGYQHSMENNNKASDQLLEQLLSGSISMEDFCNMNEQLMQADKSKFKIISNRMSDINEQRNSQTLANVDTMVQARKKVFNQYIEEKEQLLELMDKTLDKAIKSIKVEHDKEMNEIEREHQREMKEIEREYNRDINDIDKEMKRAEENEKLQLQEQRRLLEKQKSETIQAELQATMKRYQEQYAKELKHAESLAGQYRDLHILKTPPKWNGEVPVPGTVEYTAKN